MLKTPRILTIKFLGALKNYVLDVCNQFVYVKANLDMSKICYI